MRLLTLTYAAAGVAFATATPALATEDFAAEMTICNAHRVFPTPTRAQAPYAEFEPQFDTPCKAVEARAKAADVAARAAKAPGDLQQLQTLTGGQ